MLETTAEHPFYTIDGEWIDAGELVIGAEILSFDGGYGIVEAVVVVETNQRMYNLTVDGAHTFFVGDGAWLVHNTQCKLSQQDTNRIRDIIRRHPITGGECKPCARQIVEIFDGLGIEAQIGHMETIAPFLTTHDGIQLSFRNAASNPFHEFVRVGDVIYDALTGPNGMTWDKYKDLFYEGVFDDGTIRVTYRER